VPGVYVEVSTYMRKRLRLLLLGILTIVASFELRAQDCPAQCEWLAGETPIFVAVELVSVRMPSDQRIHAAANAQKLAERTLRAGGVVTAEVYVPGEPTFSIHILDTGGSVLTVHATLTEEVKRLRGNRATVRGDTWSNVEGFILRGRLRDQVLTAAEQEAGNFAAQWRLANRRVPPK
jgi:hypothetical protein